MANAVDWLKSDHPPIRGRWRIARFVAFGGAKVGELPLAAIHAAIGVGSAAFEPPRG